MSNPLNIAHRGGAALYPENTLAAFRDAVARGCDGAELDVQLSSDGKVVVFHDFNLKPEICRDRDGLWLTRPTPRIKDLTFAELQSYDVGRPDPESAYSRSHPDVRPRDGERIPRLQDVIAIARMASKPFKLFIEIKTSFAQRDLSAAPEALAEATIAVLRAESFLDSAILVGFDWPALLHARKIAPDVECWFTTLDQSWFGTAEPAPQSHPPNPSTLRMMRHWANTGTSPWAGGYDAVNYGGSIIKAIKAAGGDGWFPYFPDATSEALAEARGAGLKVGAWTVDSPRDIERLASQGIDAICSDRPDLVAEIVR